MLTDEQYMQIALGEAKKAAAHNEVPIGAIIVGEDGDIAGRGYNTTERDCSPLAHAELTAIRKAALRLDTRRLTECTIYVTLEPCPMCAGAIIMARMGRVFYGARDDLTGSCGSVINLFMEPYGHLTQITGGILADECSALLSMFFKTLRDSGK
jgi:tRNA(adenine34) deaminase